MQGHHTPVRAWPHIQSVLQDVVRIERSWQAAHPPSDPRHIPYIPFPLFDFISMLAEALVEARGGRYLEIGAGPGSKMMIAAGLFGLDARGFDICEPMTDYARSIGLNVEQADAMDYSHYHEADIVWFNRVFQNPMTQVELENKVWTQLNPGTVVVCANLEQRPPSSWPIILDDMEIRRGSWQKPISQG